MSVEIDNLKQEYQSLKAPPYLATRIRAEVKERSIPRQIWLAVSVTLALAILSVTILSQKQATQIDAPTMLSLPMVSRLTPEKPRISVPGLSQIRSVATPALPPKPILDEPKEPQTNFRFEEENPKETDHANI